MTENEKAPKQGAGMAKASMVCGIIAVVLSLLPLLSAWFMALCWIGWVLEIVSVTLGVIALVKGQRTKAIIGLVCSALAIILPFALAEYYVGSTLESASNLMDMLN